MKKLIRSLAAMLSAAMLLILFGCAKTDYDTSLTEAPSAADSLPLRHIIDPDSEVRGIWIASVYNIDFPSRADLTAYELRAEIDDIIATCAKSGINTIYFQVRPSCDALYASDIFPTSAWLTHAGYLEFDPLGYILDAAHQNNIFVHAWVNPLRVSVNSTDIASLPDGSPAKAHPEWVVEYNGQLYFDAGIPEVRSLVVDGVREIVEKYDVDGVVFDDYFYPYPAADSSGAIIPFDDAETYAKCSTSTNIEDWRRDNINQMIRGCHEAVHSADSECVFGVSPFGVWQNDNGENGGSATRNLEGYSSLYCDALAWAKGGYVDFLSPQLYWNFTNEISPFDTVMRWWNAALDGTSVKLIPSHALYQYGEAWADPADEISEQIAYARAEKTYFGSVCYGYSKLKENYAGAADELARTYADERVYTNIQSNGLGVTVTSPESGSVTYTDRTYLIGSCDPFYTLTMNGTPVSLTKSGYFSMFVTLEEGENTLVFEQNGKQYEYKITYKTSYGDIGETEKKGQSTDGINVLEVYPFTSVATPSTTTWVHCVAPEGSKVTAEIGGRITELPQLTKPVGNEDGYACVTYGAEAELPKAPDGGIIDCGNVKVTVTHKDGEVTADGADVRVLGKDAMLCVRAAEDYTELKITENSSYYNDYTVQSAGMTDYADRLEDGFYHLRMGGYVYESSVEEIEDVSLSDKCKIKSAKVKDSGRETSIIFQADDNMPYNGCIDGGSFIVTFYNADSESAPEPEIADNPFFDSCEIIRLNGKVRYSFPLFDVDNFYGFDLEYRGGEIVVTLRDPISIDTESDTPLRGLTIVLDAGHGGGESGAAGAKSGITPLDEEDLNLAIVLSAAEKLRALGAEVLLTRETDKTFDLYGRMDYLEAVEPDLCVSVHQNSMDYSIDSTHIRGTLGLWTMDGGAMLSDCVGRSVALSLGRHWQGTRYQMLAMCRNPKFPAALIEVGYMTSVEEYESITSAHGIEKAASGIVDGILDYFSRQAEYLK